MRDADEQGPCPLCGRAMVAGPSVNRHHWVPRSRGGRVAEPIHTICHRKIHALFDERTLAASYDTADKLRDHPEVARFLIWVANKPPTFTSRHRSSRRRWRPATRRCRLV